jgi:hypothetical protein
MTTATLTDAYEKLNIHFNDDSESIIARNFLMIHIILADGFDPTNPTDLQYLWDIWYHQQWNKATKIRFIKDVKQLLADQWSPDLVNSIPNTKGVEQFKKICSFWLNSVDLKANHVEAVLENRYVEFI